MDADLERPFSKSRGHATGYPFISFSANDNAGWLLADF
jgi:hypothetical protein